MSTSIHVSLGAGRRLAGPGRARGRRSPSGGRPTSSATSASPPSARFVQLTAIGYAIKLIFDADTIWLVLALLAVMVLFGALTARSRAKKVPDAFWPLLIALALAGAGDPRPGRRARHLRTDAALPGPGRRDGDRQRDDRLGGGAEPARRRDRRLARRGSRRPWRSARPPSEAAAPIVRRALRSGMITLVDSTKTTGLIFFPGTMVGMLLAGADPTDAVRLQLILLYALLGSVAIAGLVATGLAYRNFFTPAAAAARAGRGLQLRRAWQRQAQHQPSMRGKRRPGLPGEKRSEMSPIARTRRPPERDEEPLVGRGPGEQEAAAVGRPGELGRGVPGRR